MDDDEEDGALKAKIALEALREQMADLAQRYESTRTTYAPATHVEQIGARH